MNNQTNHLNDETILWSMIDAEKIQDIQSKHLNECLSCQKKQSDVINELTELGRLTRQYAPTPRRSLRPVSIAPDLQFLRLKRVFVYASMIMICVGGVLGLWPTQYQQRDEIAVQQAKEEIEQLLRPISEDNWTNETYSILPDAFRYMVADEFDIMDVPFYDYVFPIDIPVNEPQENSDEQTKYLHYQGFQVIA
ncbi:MAG: hypothetical protein HQK75_16260 [Candidatus Magnetomorum sp.]|nr:hypothetical protein [Candidatus Magnetomorum sp.]